MAGSTVRDARIKHPKLWSFESRRVWPHYDEGNHAAPCAFGVTVFVVSLPPQGNILTDFFKDWRPSVLERARVRLHTSIWGRCYFFNAWYQRCQDISVERGAIYWRLSWNVLNYWYKKYLIVLSYRFRPSICAQGKNLFEHGFFTTSICYHPPSALSR